MMLAQATKRAFSAADASLRAVFMAGAVTRTIANFLADLIVEFLDQHVAIKNFRTLKLQGDSAFLERNPLVVDHLSNVAREIIGYAINYVGRAVAVDDDFDAVPAFALVHWIAND